MASNYTANFNLSQWAENDEVLRTDFNADNLKLDTAVQAVKSTAEAAEQGVTALSDAYTPRNKPFIVGAYAGNAPSAPKSPAYQTISLGFTPSFVHVFRPKGEATVNYNQPNLSLYMGSAGTNRPLIYSDKYILKVIEGGFTVLSWWDGGNPVYPDLNNSTCSYYYIAFR